MHDFLEDLRQRKTFAAKMAALTGGAVALGMGIPVVFINHTECKEIKNPSTRLRPSVASARQACPP